MKTLSCRAVCCIALSALFLSLNGCATIAGGTSQNVSFQSEPEGVTVSVDGQPLGKTPVSARLDKAKNQTLTFEKTGYKTRSMELTTGIEPWFFGNLVTGGFFGSTTDVASGAVYEYSPEQYFVTLTPSSGTGGLLEQSQEVERFVVVNFAALQAAAISGEQADDEVFESLMRLLSIHPRNDEAAERLGDTLTETDDAARAADRVTARFGT